MIKLSNDNLQLPSTLSSRAVAYTDPPLQRSETHSTRPPIDREWQPMDLDNGILMAEQAASR